MDDGANREYLSLTLPHSAVDCAAMRQLTDEASMSITELARQYDLEDGSARRKLKPDTGETYGYRKYRHRTDSMDRGRAAQAATRAARKAAA